MWFPGRAKKTFLNAGRPLPAGFNVECATRLVEVRVPTLYVYGGKGGDGPTTYERNVFSHGPVADATTKWCPRKAGLTPQQKLHEHTMSRLPTLILSPHCGGSNSHNADKQQMDTG